jgi:glycerol-3-phosphate cytidylyltransferase
MTDINIKNNISGYKNYKSKNNILLLNDDIFLLDILNQIVKKNIGIVNILDINIFIKASFNMLLYFPNIQINLFINDITFINKFDYNHLNNASTVYVKNNKQKKILENISYLTKSNIKITKIITFGTFDLFHQGHSNILDRCKDLSDNITIGVSTDELNNKKGKSSFDSLDKRINNIKKNCTDSIVFKEYALEEKDNYIKKYNSNLLVMGDDWENKFNWVSCDVLYFPRTHGISSTMLRNKLIKGKK